ncbi:hypothetical protein [Pedobacter sp. R-06]|uniref:hypothetical protein n=1 Tax=Pedobacter sp. R-06 TaxID=3404051 RepID=UPI003CF83BDB
MNQNPIVLYIDGDNNHNFLNYTQDSDKISKNINHFGEERMLLFDSMAIPDVDMVETFLSKLFNSALSDDFLYKLEYLKSHSSRSFYPVLLSSDIPSPD